MFRCTGDRTSAPGAHVDRSQDTVAVIGAGTIGLSWAALFAAHGFTVRVQDPRPDVGPEVEAAVRHYAGLRAGGAAGGLEELLARIEVVGDVEAAVTGAADPTGRGSRVLQGSSSASPPRHRRCAGATFP